LGLHQLCYLIGLLKSTRGTFSSNQKSKAFVIGMFSRALRQLHVMTWSLIGSLDCLGDFLGLVLRQSTEDRSRHAIGLNCNYVISPSSSPIPWRQDGA